MNSITSQVPSDGPNNERFLLKSLIQRFDDLDEKIQKIIDSRKSKEEIDLKARYQLKEAAKYLGISTSTLSKRAREKKFIIVHDGSKPFVMGAEIMRYAREGAKRRFGPRRRHLSRRSKTRG